MNAKVNYSELKRNLAMDLIHLIDEQAKIHNVVFQTAIEVATLDYDHIRLNIVTPTGSEWNELNIWRGRNDDFAVTDELRFSSQISYSDFESDKYSEDLVRLTYLMTFKSIRNILLGTMKQLKSN